MMKALMAFLVFFATAPAFAKEVCASKTWLVYMSVTGSMRDDAVVSAFDLLDERTDFRIVQFETLGDSFRRVTIVHDGRENSLPPETLIEALREVKGVGVVCYSNPDVPFPTARDPDVPFP